MGIYVGDPNSYYVVFWDRNAWSQPCAHITCLCKGRLQPDTYSFLSLLSGLGKPQRSFGQQLATLPEEQALVLTDTNPHRESRHSVSEEGDPSHYQFCPRWQDRDDGVQKNASLTGQNAITHGKGRAPEIPPPHTDLSRSCYFQLVLILSPQMCHLLKRKALSINSKSVESMQLKNT